MKTKISNIKTKYFVNEKEGVVVCVVSGFIYSNPFTLKGVAKCNLSVDKFNETTGRRIAESRAKAKMFKKAMKVHSDFLDFFEYKHKEALSLVKACEHCFEKEVNHIKELL
jgi:uncharacterized protein YkuJ